MLQTVLVRTCREVDSPRFRGLGGDADRNNTVLLSSCFDLAFKELYYQALCLSLMIEETADHLVVTGKGFLKQGTVALSPEW